MVKTKDYYARKGDEHSLLLAIDSLVKTIPRGLIHGSNQSFADILELEERVKEKFNSYKKSQKIIDSQFE